MSPHRARLTSYVGASSLLVIVRQGIPLLVLVPHAYGFYSIVQLVIVLSSTIALALVNEADARFAGRTGHKTAWHEKSPAILSVTIFAALLAAIVALSFAPLRPQAVVWALLVGLTIYQQSTSYTLTQEGHLRRLIIGRLGAAALMTLTASMMHLKGTAFDLDSVAFIQFIGTLVSVLFTRVPTNWSLSAVYTWIRDRKSDARILMVDGALQDFGTFWAPNAIALILSVTSLGVYRAAITVASPVVFVLTPLRPLLVGRPLATTARVRGLVLLWTAGCLVGGLASAGLLAVGEIGAEVGTVTALIPFTAPIAIFVSGTAISHILAVVGRIHLDGRLLLIGRVCQAGLLGLLPVAGAAVGGLSAAMWGLGTGSVCVGLVWSVLLHWTFRREKREPQG